MKVSAEKPASSPPPESASGKAPARAKPRTPNAERSATTRARILNATIDCLCDVGYHNTSTVLVTERAGVSRGAMLHHFPTKAELVLATFAHIRRLRVDAHDGALALMKTDRDKFLHLIDALWTTIQTPPGIARLEIMIGARCDPEVGPAFGEQHHHSIEMHLERAHNLARSLDIRNRKKVDAFVMLYVAALRGLLMQGFYPSPRGDVDIKAAIALLKDIQVDMFKTALADG